MPFDASKYYTYDEITAMLEGWAAEHGGICELSSIGSSTEGRELWLLTITDAGTGPHDEKPAMWLDANTHAGEVTGCTALLHFTDMVLSGHASGDEVYTRLLATSTLYILPRFCPDGAELYLTTPYTCRSTPILWPQMPEDIPGFRQEDVDGDGHITMMRIPDPVRLKQPILLCAAFCTQSHRVRCRLSRAATTRSARRTRA